MSLEPEKSTEFSFWKLTQLLWPSLRPYRTHFALGFALILLSTGIDLFNPLLVGWIVDTIGQDNAKQAVTHYCALFLGLVALRFGVKIARAYVIQSTGEKLTHDLRHITFEKVLRFPVSYFDKNPVGRPLTRIINDIKALGEVFGASISVIVIDIILIVGTVVSMTLLHWQLALVILVIFPVIVWTMLFFSKRLASLYRNVRTHLSSINSFLGENISAIATIQQLSAEKHRSQKFDQIVDQHFDAQMKSVKTYATVHAFTNTYRGVAMAVLIGIGGYWAVQGQLSIGVLVTFLEYIRNIFQPIRDLVEKYNLLLSAKVSGERIVSLWEDPVEFPPEHLQLNRSPSPQSAIRFVGVSFRYPTREEFALRDINLFVPSGSSLAVVGPTGSGKSSLIRLLLRFYDATDGEIWFADQPLQHWSKPLLRQHIGLVHQEIYLLRGSLRENLSLGRTDLSDDFLIEQCQKTQLWDLVESRGGLDFLIYEGGTNLSLGERQLVSFARVLSIDPSVFVLDEATSSIDRQLESRLIEAIQTVLNSRTSIIIAHRLSTIVHCDQLVVLRNGRIAQQGTYNQLVTQDGLFREWAELSRGGVSESLS